MYKKIFIVFLITFILLILIKGVSYYFGSCERFFNKKTQTGNVLFFEDFSGGMDNWWIEGSSNVFVKNERLYVNADAELTDKNVSTVWCKKKFPPDIQVSFDAHIIQSSTGVNNINFFLLSSSPYSKKYNTSKEGPPYSMKFYSSMLFKA